MTNLRCTHWIVMHIWEIWHALQTHTFSNLLLISSWWPKLVFLFWIQAAESWQLEELLLLQSGTKGRVYCAEYLHAWQISWVDWRGSIGCGHAVWCQLFQHRLGGVFFLVDYVNWVGGVIDVLFGRFTTRHPSCCCFIKLLCMSIISPGY